MVLRCLQSAGSSGAIALANGVVSDIVTPSERGSFIAFASIGSILGPLVSPIIGGLITQYADWHWIFWFLFIFCGIFCIPFFLFFPETCRNIVGNGSITPPPIYCSLTVCISGRKRVDLERQKKGLEPRKIKILNPLSTMRVFAVKPIAMILAPSGISFGLFYAVFAGASELLKRTYGLNQLELSLMYIPLGVGGIVAALTTGQMVDWNFKRHATLLGIKIVENKRQELSSFPVEKARLQIGVPLLLLGNICIVAYGWTVHQHASIWCTTILLLVISWTLAALFQVMNVLLVNTYPRRGATVSAAVNLVRCELGAAASAAINPLTDGVRVG